MWGQNGVSRWLGPSSLTRPSLVHFSGTRRRFRNGRIPLVLSRQRWHGEFGGNSNPKFVASIARMALSSDCLSIAAMPERRFDFAGVTGVDTGDAATIDLGALRHILSTGNVDRRSQRRQRPGVTSGRTALFDHSGQCFSGLGPVEDAHGRARQCELQRRTRVTHHLFVPYTSYTYDVGCRLRDGRVLVNALTVIISDERFPAEDLADARIAHENQWVSSPIRCTTTIRLSHMQRIPTYVFT